MLATLVSKPFHDPGWVYEEKYDGFRLLAYKEGAHVTLLSRNAKDRTSGFAAIAAAVAQLPAKTLLLDGEAVAFDPHGLSKFQLLQGGHASRYAVFDCLYENGRDLRGDPLSARRQIMENAIGTGRVLLPSRRLDPDGMIAFEQASQRGMEGLVAKDNASPYVEGRSKLWLKVKVHQQDEFVIGGFTAPAGSRQYIGALLLGAYENGKLRYVGKVGTGFNTRTLASLHATFQPLVREKPPFVDAPRERDVTWLKPALVAQIAYQEWTADRKLRQPVFLGLRDDKSPADVVMPSGPTG
ncbi:MAG TPA: non-homologous end-joining DNA ligase [Bradyrhizobium sp.]|nr:non-homologous end-joining DNA ligase [Bradyrhizobium sp.]